LETRCTDSADLYTAGRHAPVIKIPNFKKNEEKSVSEEILAIDIACLNSQYP
jgi:hypothetical protein